MERQSAKQLPLFQSAEAGFCFRRNDLLWSWTVLWSYQMQLEHQNPSQLLAICEEVENLRSNTHFQCNNESSRNCIAMNIHLSFESSKSTLARTPQLHLPPEFSQTWYKHDTWREVSMRPICQVWRSFRGQKVKTVFPHFRYYPTITTKSDHHFQEKIPSSRSMLTLKGLSLSISCSMGSFLYAYSATEVRVNGYISALRLSSGGEICCQRLKFVSLSRYKVRRILMYLTFYHGIYAASRPLSRVL